VIGQQGQNNGYRETSGAKQSNQELCPEDHRLSDALPRTRAGNVIGHQIPRSATSVAANYRASGRARSKAEFIAKIGIVIEEADETVLWLELLAEGNILPAAKLEGLLTEARQLLAIFSASGRTAKK
jgi:four helix bundle protein